MKEQTWKFTGKSLSEKEIAKFEKLIGFDLPTDYRDFIKKFNGGTPSKKNFRLKNKSGYWLDCLLPITKEPDLADAQEAIKAYGEFFPRRSVPIGIACGESYILLMNDGKIVYKDMDAVSFLTDEPVDRQQKAGVHLLAKSFREFLNSLSAPMATREICFLALDSTKGRASRLDAILKKLGCQKKRVVSMRPTELWDWPKFKGIERGCPAWLEIEKNNKIGYRSKFQQRPTGHPILVVSVASKDRVDCISELSHEIPECVLLEVKELK